MVRRLLLGLVLGLVIGGLVGAGLVAGLGVLTFRGGGGAALAYLAAAVTGVLTGLVAGKPIWSGGAKIEAGLKALFGALVGAGLMFALRRWGGSWMVDLPVIGANGPTALGDLPAVSLPLLAAALGSFFELDNTGAGEDEKKAGPEKGRSRVAPDRAGPARARISKTPLGAPAETDSDDEAGLVSKRAKR